MAADYGRNDGQQVIFGTRKILKNIILLSFVFLLLFIAYSGLASLQVELFVRTAF